MEQYSYEYSGSVEISIWAYRSAGWQQVTTEWVFVDGGTYSDGGLKSFSWSIANRVLQLGSDVQRVGVSVASFNAYNATVDSFTLLSWQAQGSSGGVRSATPNGEKTTVIVSP